MAAALHLQGSAVPYKTEGPRQKSLLTIEQPLMNEEFRGLQGAEHVLKYIADAFPTPHRIKRIPEQGALRIVTIDVIERCRAQILIPADDFRKARSQLCARRLSIGKRSG